MLSEPTLKILSEMGMRPVIGGGGGGRDAFNTDDLEKEIGLLLRDQRRQGAVDREGELNLYRSGSAPPTVEGSLAAVGGFFGGGSAGFGSFSSEEELRSDPAYVDYYYSHVNLNPRLPPPVLSKEDWRFAQRLQAGSSAFGGIGDKRKSNKADEGEMKAPAAPASGEWLDREGDGLIGLSGLVLGSRKKSFAEILQDDLGSSNTVFKQPSRPASRNAFDDSTETLESVEAQLAHLNEISSNDNGQKPTSVQPRRLSSSHTFASVVGGSLSKNASPDPQLVARIPSPCLPPVGVKMVSKDKQINNGFSPLDSTSTSIAETGDLVGAFSSLNLARTQLINDDNKTQSKRMQDLKNQNEYPFDMQGVQNHRQQPSYLKKSDSGRKGGYSMASSANFLYPDFNKRGPMEKNDSLLMPERHSYIQSSIDSSTNSYLKVSPSNTPSSTSPGGSPALYHNSDSLNSLNSDYGQSSYSLNPVLPTMLASQVGTGSLPPLFENAALMSALGYPGVDSLELGVASSGLTAGDLQNLDRNVSHAAAVGLQMPFVDPLYLQYLRTAEYAARASSYGNPSIDRNNATSAYIDGLQRAYLGALLESQKQYGMPSIGKSGNLSQGYYGNSGVGAGMPFHGASVGSPVFPASPVGPGSPLRHGDWNTRFSSCIRSSSGGLMGSSHLDAVGNFDEGFVTSLLDEFKCNKNRFFELSEIAGHVVEFSADQYGSRFIQQKLETATTEEKKMVYEEIMPQALSLMTDVFGNYVIQKFFEHGSAAQIRELADQLTGHVLTLSLQMYGCRVIQKAIEVVDLDQQTKMVAELADHVMRCVRDQNGNHVIQKCIECIPQEAIQFIISTFYDQVVTLSSHPYGCRVIQRVLEHCDDPKTQQIVMDEIMQCVCMLAQDQYGNYVVQHVLEHGKPHERSVIIKKLAGQIVQMSQQKFASNVVEKCLTFGGPEERQILVNEMLGTTDENLPLQAMMKDQFANYVVQKVLETCDDQQRELILSRIKVHLNALKKYTYGKHIVARVEKLVAAGERRIGIQSMYPSPMI